MALEKRLEITYGQAQGQPIGAWWKSSGRNAKTGTWRDETFMPTFFLTFIMRLTKLQHLPIKCSDSLIAWQESSQKKEECSVTPAVGGGVSGLHRKKLEEKDDEIWTMGRRESWLGRGSKHCPGEGLCSKNEDVSAEKHNAERQRPS